MAQSPASLVTSTPRVSAIIVNWNRLDDVLFNLRFLRKSGYSDLEMIVVDNGSESRVIQRLSQVRGIKLIHLAENVGPSKARNIGIAAATGKYILLLDSDAVLAKRCLGDVVAQMEAMPDIGIAGFEVLNWHTRKIDQWIYAQSYATHARETFDTYSFSAAGALIRADALKQAGGFWEDLFIYNEEVELSIRLIRAGYRVIYTPHGRVYHRPSSEGRASRANYFKNQIRNWIWIFFRHYPKPRAWWRVGIYSAAYLAKGAANRNFKACAAGILEGVGGRWMSDIYVDKLSPDQARRIDALNPRKRVRLWDRPASEPLPKRRRIARYEALAADRLIEDDELAAAAS